MTAIIKLTHYLLYPVSARTMPDLEYLRAEIERMRVQVHRQRGDIRQLQRAGISTVSAEALLERMLVNIDTMCAERDKLKKELGSPIKGRVLGGRSWHVVDAKNAAQR